MSHVCVCVCLSSMCFQLWHILVVSLLTRKNNNKSIGATYFWPYFCSSMFHLFRSPSISVTDCEWNLRIDPQQKRMVRNRKWLYFNRHWIFSTIFSLLQFRLNSPHVVWMWWLIFQKMETTKMYASDSGSDSRTHTSSRLLAIFVRLCIINTQRKEEFSASIRFPSRTDLSILYMDGYIRTSPHVWLWMML